MSCVLEMERSRPVNLSRNRSSNLWENAAFTVVWTARRYAVSVKGEGLVKFPTYHNSKENLERYCSTVCIM